VSSQPRGRRGEKLAPVFRIVGPVLLVAGLVHLYADRVIFDAGAFSARAAASLQDPRVASFVAERLTDEIVAQQRDLVAFRPLLVTTTRAIVASGPFAAGFRRAAQGAHAALFSQSAEQVALSVPDLAVLVRGALTHDPEIAARLPPRIQGDLRIQPVGDVSRALLSLMRLGHRFQRNAWLAIGGGLLLLVLGIALPPDRRRALLHGGAALGTVGLVLFFLPALARAAIVFSIPEPGLRPVSAGIFDAFTAGLRIWALVLAGMGVVLAAAASSFASRVEIGDVARRAWGRISRPAPTSAGEMGRASVLLALGLVAILRPAATLQALTVVAGALLAFEGLRQLFLLVPPRVHEAALRAGEGPDESRGGESGARTWLRAAIVGAVVLASIAGSIAFIQSRSALPPIPVLTDACNGDRALCDRRLEEVVFPGAHNSMSAAEFDGWMFPNQEKGSVALLSHGVRALLFDVHYGAPVADRVKTLIEDEASSRAKFEKAIGPEAMDAAMRIRDRLTGLPTGSRGAYLCHGFCELGGRPLEPMLEGVRDFLVQNPGEVLLFVIEDYVTPQDLEAAFRESDLLRFVYRGGVTAPLPTLRELIDGNQRVVVFIESGTPGVPWLHPAFETIQETPYTFHTTEEFSCRENRGEADAPLFLINHWIETTPTPRPSNAAIVNAHDFLLARARQCQEERGRLPNILAVDFALTGDVVGVAAVLNGLARPSQEVIQ